jgi:hypothetical protein
VLDGESVPHARASLMGSPRTRHAKVAVFGLVLLLLSIAQYIKAQLWLVSFVSALGLLVGDLCIVRRDRGSVLSFLSQVYGRMPWVGGDGASY